MKILVTGATGFVGSYVIKELLKNNIKVIATDRDITKAKSRDWYSEVEFVVCDISNVTEEVVTKFSEADKLIHLAWEGLPNYKALFHFERNLFVQYGFLKKMVEIGIKDISVSGTCFEYGIKEGALSVDMLPDPQNPYALAKDTLRKFLQQLQLHHPFKLKWIRLFYTYGKGQMGTSLLSQLETAVANGDKEFNMSGGEQLRDYLPVEQMAEKIANFCYDDELNGIVNCCSGKPISVKRLVEEYILRNGYDIKLNFGFYPYPDYEAMAFWGVN